MIRLNKQQKEILRTVESMNSIYSDIEWKPVVSYDWLPFSEAREFARSLNLKNSHVWQKYYQSGNLPKNIPTKPSHVYRKQWVNWGDWLDSECMQFASYKRGNWRTFKEAREFVHSLKLKNATEWNVWSKSGKKPEDIPASPQNVYKKRGEWTSMGDWLGTSSIGKGKWRSFSEAREFVHSLGIPNNSSWKKWASSKDRPIDIPSHPYGAYKNNGWKGMNDWLGKPIGRTKKMDWLSFFEARKFVMFIGLKTTKEWNEYCKSGKKPINIPSNPGKAYKDKGWVNMGHWLGTSSTAKGNWISFKEARKFARSLNLKNGKEWLEYCGSGKKPEDIPASPEYVYKNNGWTNMGDWLNTKNIYKGSWISFKEARKFARSLNLKGQVAWKEYCKSGKKPINIPSNPREIYKDKGWDGFSDWLNTKNRRGNWMPFKEARKFARSLNLKNSREWLESNKRSIYIPIYVNEVYKDKGWISWPDFLGTDNR